MEFVLQNARWKALGVLTITALAGAVAYEGLRSDPSLANPARGPISSSGGSVPLLNFAVIGDSRPAKIDDTAGYPNAVIEQIYQSIEAMTPHPDFVVTTGDYMFNTPGKGHAAEQISLYMRAAQNYSGQVFPAIGNHECTGWTKSDCGAGNPDGLSENYTVFLQDMLQGLGIDSQVPYYAIHINSSDPANPWTAKFVFVAPNAWDSTQASWLSHAMAEQTTYTFIVKHEPSYDNNECKGCAASDKIIQQYPVTLFLYGHTHTFSITAPNILVVGNGGAPLDGPSDQFGFVTCHQQSDNSINCNEQDYNSSTSSYANSTITVKPSGEAVP